MCVAHTSDLLCRFPAKTTSRCRMCYYTKLASLPGHSQILFHSCGEKFPPRLEVLPHIKVKIEKANSHQESNPVLCSTYRGL